MDKKFLYITNVRMPTEKAHGIQMIKMCEAFADLGVNLDFIVPRRKNSIHEDPYSYYGVKRNFKISYIWSLDLISVFPRLGYWLQSFSFLALVVCMFLFSSRKDKIIYTREVNIAFIFNFLGFYTAYESHRILLKKKLFFAMARKLPRIIANSEGTANEFISHGFSHVLPLPNGVDLSEFKINASKEELRNRLSFPVYKKIVLYTGNFYDWKGTDTLVEAARLSTSGDPVFIFVGGSDKEVEMKKKELQEKGISNVLFMGHRNRKEIPFILKSADVLVLPNSPVSEESIKYTSPVKLGEYMASGVPIVASDLPSIRAIVSDKAAVFFKPDDAEALSESISKVLTNLELAKDISSHALLEVEKYSWQKRASSILEFIK
jgi:glycosyltransferase involved in cell wall biosynthesis